MDSKDKIISEISTAMASLTLKLETLQAKVDELCKSTGGCDRLKKVNKDLVPPVPPIPTEKETKI